MIERTRTILVCHTLLLSETFEQSHRHKRERPGPLMVGFAVIAVDNCEIKVVKNTRDNAIHVVVHEIVNADVTMVDVVSMV